MQFRGESWIDVERLIQIRDPTDVFLVLHGGSGLPEIQIQRAIQNGITGIRFAREMRFAFLMLEKESEKSLATTIRIRA
jgi:tagatose 1,6-diphosphate aldolase GatY/KbaY